MFSLLTQPLFSDEGCATVCCSSEEDLAASPNNSELTVGGEKRVARSSSADSAVDLEESPKAQAEDNAISADMPKRRMTLTVTDLPLRQALLPLPEPLALANCCDAPLSHELEGCSSGIVPSKTLLESQLIELPIIPLDKETSRRCSTSRRESSLSCLSDNGTFGDNVRILRTPSVVVSDYSDDVVCGITLEEIEYFRRHRLGRRFSSDERDIDFDANDMSAASSCSNLNYCGSHISIVDGLEINYETGLRTPERKMSASSCSTLSGGEEDDKEVIIAKEKVSERLNKK